MLTATLGLLDARAGCPGEKRCVRPGFEDSRRAVTGAATGGWGSVDLRRRKPVSTAIFRRAGSPTLSKTDGRRGDRGAQDAGELSAGLDDLVARLGCYDSRDRVSEAAR